MELPERKPLLALLALALGLYVLILPLWFVLRDEYAHFTVAVANNLVLPTLDISGGISVDKGQWITLTYVLPFAQNEWGAVRQRFFDFADVPLAIAVAWALSFFGWRRRLIVSVASSLVLLSLHLTLIGWTAFNLSRKLADVTPDQVELDRILHETASHVTRYGGISPAVALVVVALLVVVLRPRR